MLVIKSELQMTDNGIIKFAQPFNSGNSKVWDADYTVIVTMGYMHMKRLMLLGLLYFIIGGSVWALDTENFKATSIDVSQGVATLYSHESVFLGLSCKSGPVGELSGLYTISIGDTIKFDKYSFHVGIIKVSKFNEDLSWGGKTIAEKGDVVCVVAANKDSLPNDDDDCDALWLRITNCKPIK